jgi:hypothetical protein
MALSTAIELTVFADGAPAPGAILQVRRHDPGASAERGVIAILRTDESGRAQGIASLVRDEGPLEVVVIKPGFVGPYEPVEDRAQLGPFAPAARFTVTPRDLVAGVRIDLTSQEEK